MARYISLQERISTTLSAIKINTNATNAKIVLPILEWTLKKIQLSSLEYERITQQRSPRFVKRGCVYYAQLGKNIGSEQNGYRPVLVVQSNQGNVSNNTVLIIPLTDFLNNNGMPKKIMGTHVVLELSDNPSLKKKSIIKTEHINNISKSRLMEKVCELCPLIMTEVDSKILISLGIK